MIDRIIPATSSYYPKMTLPKPAWLSGFIFTDFSLDN